MSKRPPLSPSSPPPGKRMADTVLPENGSPTQEISGHDAVQHTPARSPGKAPYGDTDPAIQSVPDNDVQMKTCETNETAILAKRPPLSPDPPLSDKHHAVAGHPGSADVVSAVGVESTDQSSAILLTQDGAIVGIASTMNSRSGPEDAVHQDRRAEADNRVDVDTEDCRTSVPARDDRVEGLTTGKITGEAQTGGDSNAKNVPHETKPEELDGKSADRPVHPTGRHKKSEGEGDNSLDKQAGGSPDTGARSLNDYVSWRVRVTVALLKTPKHTLRPTLVNDAAVGTFKTLFLESEYGEGERVISVALGPDTTTSWSDIKSELERRSTEPEPPILTDFSGVSVLVADGLHRVQALKALAKDSRFHVVHANLFIRKDGHALTMGDCHTIGARQNGLDTKGRKTTAYDRVHTCLSTLQATLELSEIQLRACGFFGKEEKAVLALRENPTSKNLGALLDVRGISVVSGGRTQQRYCSVAVQLARFKEATGIRIMLHEAMMKGKNELNCGLGIGVLENSLLWTAKSPEHFKYLLVCMVRLKKRLRVDDDKVDDIISRLDGLWQAVESEFTTRGIDMEKGLQLKVLIPSRGTGQETPQLTESLLDRLRSWMSKLQLKHITKIGLWRKRLSFLLKVLAKPKTWPGDDVFGMKLLGKTPKSVATERGSAVQLTEAAPGATSRNSATAQAAMQVSARNATHSPQDEVAKAQPAGITDVPIAETENNGGTMDLMVHSPERHPTPEQDEGNGEVALVPDTQEDMPSLDPLPGQPVVSPHEDRSEDKALSTDMPEQHLGGSSKSQKEDDEDLIRKDAGTGSPGFKRRSRQVKKGTGKRKTPAFIPSKTNAEKSPASHPLSRKRLSKKRKASPRYISSGSENSASSESSESSGSGSDSDSGNSFGHVRNLPALPSPMPHLVRRTDPESWRDEIPPNTPVREDENGFRIVRRWKNGFEYKRPQQRDWGLKNVEYTPDKTDPQDGYWCGELPDGTIVNINGDTYSRKVTVPGKWTLVHLPRWDNPIWEQKYRVPYDCDSLQRPRFQHQGCKEALLRSMGFRPPHQSHFRLTLADISQIRFSVFEYFFRGVIMPKHYSDWQPYADNVFRAHRHTLDQAGYIVFKGFMSRTFRDVSQSSAEGGYKGKYKWEKMFQDVKKLFEFLEKDVPKPDTYDEDRKLRWSRIRNGRDLPVHVPLQDSRWTSTPLCTNTALEKREHQHLLKARCYVEVAIWVLVHWLHLEADDFDQIPEQVPDESEDTPFPPLYATDSGSRALGTSTQCSDQVAHKDFVTPRSMFSGGYPGGMNNPPYFVLSTGPQGCKLYILPASHGWVFYTEEAKKNLANVVGLVPVHIPPWSTLFARGDLIHAGVGNPAGDKGFFVRLHDFILRKYVPFLDQINDTVKFKLFKDIQDKVEEKGDSTNLSETAKKRN